MTFGDLKSHVCMLLGESRTAPVFYTFPEIEAALNQAQRLFAFLTLCIERSVSLALESSVFFGSQLPSDWVLPLRIKDTTLAAAPSNAKVHPARLEDFIAENLWWQYDVGLPKRYAVLGSSGLVIFPAAAAPGGSVRVRYAAMPVLMDSDGDIPEIPAEYHNTLADWAVVRLRCKEGGQEFMKEMARSQHFFEDAKKLALWTRSRYLGLGYDTVPSEEVIQAIEGTWLSTLKKQ